MNVKIHSLLLPNPFPQAIVFVEDDRKLEISQH